MSRMTFDVKSTRGDTAERMQFATEDYLLDLAADLQKSAVGQAMLVGSEEGYTGGRASGPGDGKGIATNVAEEVKSRLGKLTDLNTKVHAIKDPNGSAMHYAALSLNRSQPSYKVAQANPVKRERKTKNK